MQLALVLVLILITACRSGSTSSQPGPAAPGTSARITPEQCDSLATAQSEHCGSESQGNKDSCLALARVAEAGSCVPQAQRAFECEQRRVSACKDKACCETSASQCDPTNMDFDHCIRGYCGSHAENPDCKWVLEIWGA